MNRARLSVCITALCAVSAVTLTGCSTSDTAEKTRPTTGITQTVTQPAATEVTPTTGITQAVTPTATVCSSPDEFSFEAGSCVTGLGHTGSSFFTGAAIDIGPFRTPNAWSATIALSGRTDSGEDCAALFFWTGSGNEVTQLGNYTVGGNTTSAEADANAAWHLLVMSGEPSTPTFIDGCSWTVTFS